jgi:para-nitrobenzyl esterase
MGGSGMTRRGAGRRLLSAAALTGLAGGRAWAQQAQPGAVVDTTSGKIRGLREGPVSAFRGIPYGANTSGAWRFLPPQAPASWTGVRDGFAFGHRAPQGSLGPGRIPPGVDPAVIAAVQKFMQGQLASGYESEDCLVLNVFTPDPSPRRRRPVMFWLHGGGFAVGSANEPVYEGGALAHRGDVVVVTINHRLAAPGYLYLGALDPQFNQSGNAGQLDQILALRWVRDNIAGFGGDPGNVTIFGESGGGAKVATLLGMPAAQGLFHKAIIQSGAQLRGIPKADAADFAERTLKVLDIAPADARKAQDVPIAALMKAAETAQGQLKPGARVLAPVTDGTALPVDPFDPVAAPTVSPKVPVIIGSNKDEATLFNIVDPKFGKMTLDDAHARFRTNLKDKGDEAFGFYRQHRPDEAGTWLFTSMVTESGTWINSIRIAERKAAQGGAPVYMYRLDYQTPLFDGMLRSPHGLDTPMVFDHAAEFAGMLGPGPDPVAISGAMVDAWTAFARSGDPSTPSLAWPRYEPHTRKTMIFERNSHVVGDPEQAFRVFWSS